MFSTSAIDPVALGVDVELGDLAAVVGHLELVGAGRRARWSSTSQASSVAATAMRVGGGRRARRRPPPPQAARVRAASASDGERGRAGGHAGDMLGGLRVDGVGVRGAPGRARPGGTRAARAASRKAVSTGTR